MLSDNLQFISLTNQLIYWGNLTKTPIQNKGGIMLHEPSVILGTDNASKKKANLGIVLFILYAVIYAIFVIIGLSYTELLGMRVIAGLNLAVVYGIGLIILAAVMGYFYSMICTNMENKMNKEEKP